MALSSGPVRDVLRRADSYPTLLVLILATFLAFPFLQGYRWSDLVYTTLFSAIALLAFHTSRVRPSVMWAAVTFATLAIVLDLLAGISDVKAFEGSSNVLGAMLLIATPGVILYRILRHPTITLKTVSGAVCVYMLLGFSFATVFSAIEQIEGQAFFGLDRPLERAELVYFSFVTMTTVGYGDIVATSDFARSIAVLEALVGQIFLITLVARTVSLLGTTRTDSPGALEFDPEPDDSLEAEPHPPG